MFLRLIFLISAAILFAQPAYSFEGNAEPCQTIEECLALIPELSIEEWNAGEIEEPLKDKILSYGRDALQPLVALLDHPNPNMVAVSDTLIGDLSGLVSGDLALVKEAVEKKRRAFGNYIMSYFAVATIGDKESINFLIQELIRTWNKPKQVGIAVRRLGAKGIPSLIRAFVAGELCNEKSCIQIQEIFEFMEEEARDAVPLLLNIAKNKDEPLRIRKLAIKSLGKIGVVAHASGPELLRLRSENIDDFGREVFFALIEMKHPLALNLLNLDWDLDDELWSNMRTLSSMGEGAFKAGPKIVEVLESRNWDNRVAAARALGFIGYKPAIPLLIETLKTGKDWKLAYVSAEALGMLNARFSLPILEEISNDYWYPLVRQAAVNAKEKINKMKSEKETFPGHYSPLHFLEYDGVASNFEACESTNYPIFEDKNLSQATNQEKEEELLNSFFKTRNFCEYDDAGEIIEKNGCAQARRKNLAEFAIKVPGGWLAGGDWGEWGGEIVYYDEIGNFEVLLEENTQAIYLLPSGIYAVTGLAHMFRNDAMIFSLSRNEGTGWKVKKVVRLPGDPRSTYRISENEVLINTNGGSVIFDQTPNLKMATCEIN